MKTLLSFLILVNTLFAIDTFKSEEIEIREIMLHIGDINNNEKFINEANSFKLSLNKNYKELASIAFYSKDYNIRKICQDNNINDKVCLSKFIDEIKINDFYGEFRDDKLSLRHPPIDRTYIEYLYNLYPNEKRYISVNFDKEDISILDYHYLLGEKKESLKDILNYIYLFGVFLFLLMIGRDFRAKETKQGALLYITTITSIYLFLYFLY